MALTDPTSTAPADTDRLGCGRHIDDVWDHLDHPPDAHEQTCPDCQTARTSLTGLATAIRQLHTADLDDPTLHTSPAVLTSIISVARAEVRRSRRIPLEPPSPAGELTISEQTIAGIVRRTSDDIAGIEARRCAVRLTDPGTEVPNDYQATDLTRSLGATANPSVTIHVRLQISIAAGLSIPGLTSELRSRIQTAIEQQVGVTAGTIDITVEDIHD